MGTTPSTPLDEPPPARRHEPGDPIVLREIWRGRVWAARPALVVLDEPNLRMFHVPAGTKERVPVDDRGAALRLPTERWRLAEATRPPRRVLSFAFPDTPYAVLALWDEGPETFAGWYVNLQDPLRPGPLGYDTTDHVLDVRIAPDRSGWTWKDEDELEDAIERGLVTELQAAWFRYWGERAVEHLLLREPPFDRDWQNWEPDPSWPTPTLPEDPILQRV
jgi:hypothetical protein